MCNLNMGCCEDEDEESCRCCCHCSDICCSKEDCSNCCGSCCGSPGCNCFSYHAWLSFMRAFFLFLHTLLIATSIFGLIWANVYFNDFDRIFTGTIVGGHLATLSIGGILFGLSGLYAAIKRHRRLLYTHTMVGWFVVLLRGFTWLLAMLHEYPLPSFFYALIPLEVTLTLIASMLLRDASMYF